MKTALCDMLGIEIPVAAFSHCRDVVAAVSNAGGVGVLGASSHTPERLFANVRPHPPEEDIRAISAAIEESQADVVVAVGGASVLTRRRAEPCSSPGARCRSTLGSFAATRQYRRACCPSWPSRPRSRARS
jgi:Iron-containing alcohol dehydrogenase